MVVAFVRFLYDMLSSEKYAHVFAWNSEGTAFTILDPTALQRDLFPQFFKCKWVSFLTYFSKSGFVKHQKYWRHPCFTRENPQLECIRMMQRRKKIAWEETDEEDEKEDSSALEEDLKEDSCEEEDDSSVSSDPSSEPSVPVIGYTANSLFRLLQPGECAFFSVQGQLLPANSCTLSLYSQNPIATPCIIAGTERVLIHGAVFHLDDPRGETWTRWRVTGYRLGCTKMCLLENDVVVFYYRGQWSEVITRRDVELAQKPEARTYVVRPGDCVPLPSGAQLYSKEESSQKALQLFRMGESLSPAHVESLRC